MTFEQVYAEKFEVIKAYIQKRVRNLSDAEDITQEVFLTFHGHMDAARHTSSYLYAVAQSKLVDFCRKRKARREECNLSAIGFDTADPRSQVADLELDLSPEMKLRIEGYSFREIAAKLSVHEVTLRRRIHVERKALKRKVLQCR